MINIKIFWTKEDKIIGSDKGTRSRTICLSIIWSLVSQTKTYWNVFKHKQDLVMLLEHKILPLTYKRQAGHYSMAGTKFVL